MKILISPEDEDFVLKKVWFFSGIYLATSEDGVQTYLHRRILNALKGQVVDHINGDTLDNRRHNLRICTQAQNNLNAAKTTSPRTSQYKGVSFRKSHGLFQATISKDKIQYHLGYFVTENEAALAYNLGAVKIHGPFARLNVLIG